MDYKASKNRPLRIAFVLTPANLERLAEILREASPQVEFRVRFADGTVVEYKRVDEVTKLPNSDHRSIVSMVVATVGDEEQISANVTLKSRPEADEPTVEYLLSGPQRTVVYVSDQLDPWIGAIRQWYSGGLSNAAAFVLSMTAFVLPIIVWKYASHLFFPQAVLQSKSYSWLPLVAVTLLWVLEYFVFQLFPRGTFAIGKQATKAEVLSKVRWGVLIAAIVSFAVSVLANILTQH